MTLYEIDTEIRLFLDNLMESVNEDGEVTDELNPERLSELQAEREHKLESIALYVKNLTAEAKAIKEEEDTLKKRREATERKAERLKGLLSASLLNAGETSFKTAKCAVSFKRSSSVEIIDEMLLDPMYIVQKIENKADKNAIKKALNDGKEVRGAYLKENQNIQIK